MSGVRGTREKPDFDAQGRCACALPGEPLWWLIPEYFSKWSLAVNLRQGIHLIIRISPSFRTIRVVSTTDPRARDAGEKDTSRRSDFSELKPSPPNEKSLLENPRSRSGCGYSGRDEILF